MDSREFAARIERRGGLVALQYSRKQWANQALELLETRPAELLVDASPERIWPWNAVLLRELGPLKGKRVLHLGAALGKFSVYMAKQGADVFALEPCAEAIDAARRIARLNEVNVRFAVGDGTDLVSEASSFDWVVGLSTMHHCSKPDVQAILATSSRALVPGGKALFVEGVENSTVFSFVQNLFPAGDGRRSERRPSMLSRTAWRAYVSSLEERDLSLDEFVRGKRWYESLFFHHFGLLSRLDRIVGSPDWISRIRRWDEQLLELPWLAKYCRTLMAVYVR
jgi:2-polyprenyl-3-methyl-5-hydroxy-6-metoxy-1,4-benzoquinol methylase